MSWRSAHSHFDDESESADSHHASADGDAHPDHHTGHTRRLSNGSVGASFGARPTASCTFSASGRDHGSVGHDIEEEAEDVPHDRRKSLTSRVSMTISRIAGGIGGPSPTSADPRVQEMRDHEREVSMWRVETDAFDSAMLAAHNKLHGRTDRWLAEAALLPVAPWNAGSPGYLGHLTEEQSAALVALRAAFPASGAFCTDHDLLRFLRARNFDLEATEALFWKYCHVYRGRLMVSPAPIVRPLIGPTWQPQLLDNFQHRPQEATVLFQKATKCFLHAMVFRQDRLGRPVVYFRVADIVKNCMGDYVQLGDRLAMQSAANETNRLLCMMASAAKGYHIEELFQVMDVGHVSTFAMLKYMRSTQNQAEFEFNSMYAPESIGKVVVVNGPFGVNQVWKVAQMFIPPGTRGKISICSSDYKSTLEKHIHPDDIPSCYGGRAQMEWPNHELPTQVYL